MTARYAMTVLRTAPQRAKALGRRNLTPDERRTVAHDRRVKLVVLTAKGVKMKADLVEEFQTPPADLLGLDRADLEVLQRVLEELHSAAKARTPGA